MGKLSALLAYQEADIKRQQVEKLIRKTENRQKLNRLHKQLTEQQAIVAKQAEETETIAASLSRLMAQLEAAQKRLVLEKSEMETLTQDEESTAEELTEFRKDIEKLNREFAATEREAKAMSVALERLCAENKATRSSAGKAKKEYDQLRVLCEQERSESAAEIAACTAEMEQKKDAVDSILIGKYEKARQHFGTPVVPIAGEKCSGCNMSLPVIMLRQLQPDDLAECENCGRLLYN